MKFFSFLVLILFVNFFNSFAGNPGVGSGCLVWNEKVYTVWDKTDNSPYDSGWKNVEYYKSTGEQYIVTYSNDPECGFINPNQQFNSSRVSCFVNVNGTYKQGAVGKITNLKACNVPIDDYFPLIALVLSVFGAFYISKMGF